MRQATPNPVNGFDIMSREAARAERAGENRSKMIPAADLVVCGCPRPRLLKVRRLALRLFGGPMHISLHPEGRTTCFSL